LFTYRMFFAYVLIMEGYIVIHLKDLILQRYIKHINMYK